MECWPSFALCGFSLCALCRQCLINRIALSQTGKMARHKYRAPLARFNTFQYCSFAIFSHFQYLSLSEKPPSFSDFYKLFVGNKRRYLLMRTIYDTARSVV